MWRVQKVARAQPYMHPEKLGAIMTSCELCAKVLQGAKKKWKVRTRWEVFYALEVVLGHQ